MTYAPTSVDTSTPTPIPLSSAIPDGTNTPIPIEGGPTVANSGNPITPVAVWVKDGNDVTQGLSTDANTVASVMGRLTKIRDLLNATLNVSVTNANADGQALMNASAPVVIASDQTAVKIKSDFTEQLALTAGALNADLVPSVDVSGYKLAGLHITNTAFVGTITFQGSNDNTNFVSVPGWQLDNTGNYVVSATTVNHIFVIPIAFRFLRVRMTAYTSGTANGVLELYTEAGTPLWTTSIVLGGGASSIGTVQPGNTANTTPWLVSAGPPADLTLLASAARTTTQTVADQANFAGKGLRVVLDMTTVGTGSVTLTINAKDVASGKYVLLLAGAAVTTNSTNVYVIHPELTAAANSIAKDVLPHTWQVVVTANNANSATYSVGASYLN